MKELKSITSLRPCISILFFLMTITIYANRVVANDEYKKIVQDLPAATDFDHYLSALEKAVDFCFRYKHYVDVNLQLGLFLIDVNLRPVLQQEGTSISAKIRSRLENIFEKNDVLAEYYQFMVHKNRDVPKYWQNTKCKIFFLATFSLCGIDCNQYIGFIRNTLVPICFIAVALLFYNATSWSRPPHKFNTDLLNQTTFYSPEQLEDIYGKWENYHHSVREFAKMKPSPAESDACIALLALTDPLHKNGRLQPNCRIPYRCKQVVLGGNKFGYGLTHRILFLAVARFSRRCNVISEIRDKYKTDEFCKSCFNEAQFIALNNFSLPNLMSEQIAFCGLFGHTQFLRKDWLRSPLRYQTSEGCFSDKISTRNFDEKQMRDDEGDEWKIERSLDIMNGQCNGHFTAVAVAALSNALRYITETYSYYSYD